MDHYDIELPRLAAIPKRRRTRFAATLVCGLLCPLACDPAPTCQEAQNCAVTLLDGDASRDGTTESSGTMGRGGFGGAAGSVGTAGPGGAAAASNMGGTPGNTESTSGGGAGGLDTGDGAAGTDRQEGGAGTGAGGPSASGASGSAGAAGSDGAGGSGGQPDAGRVAMDASNGVEASPPQDVYLAMLTGGKAVPATPSTSTGTARLTFAPSGSGTQNYTITIDAGGLDPTDNARADFAYGPPGGPATDLGATVMLVGLNTSGELAMNTLDITRFSTGLSINIRTPAYPNGEIRGWFVKQ